MATFEKMRLATEALRHVVPDFHKWFEGALPDGKEGLRLLEGGNYAEAEKCFQRVVAALKDRSLPRGRHARVLLALATTQWKQKRLGEARETAESARDLLTGPKTKRGAELAECLDLLGRIYSDDGDLPAASAAFQEALDIEKETRQSDSKILTERYRHLAGALWAAGHLAEAKDAFEQAVKTSEKAHGEMHTLTADCLIDLGQCLSAHDEHDAARETLEKGLEIHRQLCGADSEEVARDYQALASAAHMAKDLEASVAYYEKALHLRERQLGGNAAEFAMLLVSLAGVHSTEGRPARALELLQQAVPRLEGARD
ncbi:MAG: tetratricopeptide repeat protein, partial [Bryobacteraceae bacterium]